MRDGTPRRLSGSAPRRAPLWIEIKSIRNRCADPGDSPPKSSGARIAIVRPVMAERVLILDADTAQRGELAGSLRAEGLEVVEAATAENAIEVLRGTPVQGVLCAARAIGWSCAAVISLARAGGSDAALW